MQGEAKVRIRGWGPELLNQERPQAATGSRRLRTEQVGVEGAEGPGTRSPEHHWGPPGESALNGPGEEDRVGWASGRGARA